MGGYNDGNFGGLPPGDQGMGQVMDRNLGGSWSKQPKNWAHQDPSQNRGGFQVNTNKTPTDPTGTMMGQAEQRQAVVQNLLNTGAQVGAGLMTVAGQTPTGQLVGAVANPVIQATQPPPGEPAGDQGGGMMGGAPPPDQVTVQPYPKNTGQKLSSDSRWLEAHPVVILAGLAAAVYFLSE